jgi:hypothetical protein
MEEFQKTGLNASMRPMVTWIVISGVWRRNPASPHGSRIKFTTDAGARAKGQKIAILNADRVEYFWGVNPMGRNEWTLASV